MVNRIWPIAVAGKADSVSSVSASACHIGGPNSVNPGQILLVCGIPNVTTDEKIIKLKMVGLKVRAANLRLLHQNKGTQPHINIQSEKWI